MSDLTGKFSTLEAEITSIGDEAHSQRESEIASIDAVNASIASLDANIAALRNMMLRAISQNDPCATCPPPSLITPITSPTTQPANSDKCKRVQAFINAMHEITGVFGAATDSGLFWSPSVVTSGISEVVTTLVSGGTVPLPSFGEAVNIAGDAINYGLSNIGRGDNLQSQFDTLSTDLQAAMFAGTSPSDTQAQYEGVIDASSLPNDEKLLFKALGFNALFSYFFDPATTPNLTGYDGTICGPGTGCTILVNEIVGPGFGFGPVSTVGYDYIHLGCAGGGGSSVPLYQNGVIVHLVPIVPTGTDYNTPVTGDTTSISGSGSMEDVYINYQLCVGTIPG